MSDRIVDVVVNGAIDNIDPLSQQSLVLFCYIYTKDKTQIVKVWKL